jgi:hypothetical protein
MDTKISEQELETSVSHTLKVAGFVVEKHPRLSLFSRQRPDILVRNSGKTIAIEVKASLVGLTDILRLSDMPADKAFIVVPRGIKERMAASVVDYANQQRIEVYEADELENLVAAIKAEMN